MYEVTGARRREEELNGLGRTIAIEDPETHARCQADERRIHPVVEPSPALLVRVAAPYATHPSAHIRLHHAAHAAYLRLKQAAERAQLPARLLTIVSGYRSVATQTALWERALRRYGSPAAARVYVAPPGGSPHHTGRAIDFYLGLPNDSANIPALRLTPAYRWLVCNAARFGFTPYAAEPWHWEFNPPGLNPSLPRSSNVPASLVAGVPASSRFGYFAEVPRPAATPHKSQAAPRPVRTNWTIGHTAPGRFTVISQSPITEQVLLQMLFVDGALPAGFRVEQDPAGKGRRWHLFIPRGIAAIQENASKYNDKLAEAFGQSAMDNVIRLSAEESAAYHEAVRKHNEAVGKVFLPFLGMNFRQAVDKYGLGWFEKGGYFVWIGVTLDGTELQAIPITKDPSTNRDMRYYLNKGMSVKQAAQEVFDRGVENLRMLVVGMMS